MNYSNYQIVKHFLQAQLDFTIIALEGKCGSGKTTLANQLQLDLDITIIHVDDFFLPKDKKTKSRLTEVGGNVDYERLYQLLYDIKNKGICQYQRYNCQNNTFELITLPLKKLVLLEGVYSYHPYFNHFIDKLLFIDIDEKKQLARLQERNNYDKFVNIWIPLENLYYNSLNLGNRADLVIK